MFRRTLRQYLSFLKICNPARSYRFLERNQLYVDNVRTTDWNIPVDSEITDIVLNGKLLSKYKFTYIMLNKPVGYVCSSTSDRSPTVLQLVGQDMPAPLFIVGRLDKDTSGLLLLTDDGVFAHALTSPDNHLPKTYRLRLATPVSPAQQLEYEKRCAIGFPLPQCEKSPPFTTAPATLEWLGTLPPECLLTISEGKFHQVHRMMTALGNQVVSLERIAIGGLVLDKKIAPGQYRRLSVEDIELLFRA